MKTPFIRHFTSVFCFALMSCFSVGQSNVASAKTAYSGTPFNLLVGRLPSHYQGHDADRVFAAIEKRDKSKTKGEFETTEQYESRIKSLSQQPLFGSLRFDSLFAFKIAQLTFHYDADAAIMKVYVPTEFAVDDADQADQSRIALKVKERASFRSYPASNAFGATALVKEKDVKSTEIGVVNASDFELQNDADPNLDCFYGPDLKCFYGELHLTAEQARRLKQTAKALVIGSLADLSVSNGSSLSDATISNPIAYFGEIRYVNLRVSDMGIRP